MPESVRDRLADVHPQMAGFGPQKSGLLVGQLIARAFDYAGLEVKEAAAAMGYAEPTTVYRWLSGREQPNFDKLLTLGEKFQEGLVIGLATACASVRVETTVRVERRA